MKVFTGVITTILFIVLITATGLFIRYSSMQIERWFQPREQTIKREVFEETKSYNEGMEQQLVKYWKEYMMADNENDKKAIASVVSHVYADYNLDKLSSDLKGFVITCRKEH